MIQQEMLMNGQWSQAIAMVELSEVGYFGGTGITYPASLRYGGKPSIAYDGLGFRITLHL